MPFWTPFDVPKSAFDECCFQEVGLIRVLVIDDQLLVRQSLVRLLETTSDLRVTACASSLEEARRQLPGDFDVVILDLSLGEDDGLELLDELKTLPVVVLTLSKNAAEALQRGARAFVTKGGPSRELLSALRESAFPAPHIPRAADSSEPPTSGECG
jgi:DNA-binding NarL/FixJ family response regulator